MINKDIHRKIAEEFYVKIRDEYFRGNNRIITNHDTSLSWSPVEDKSDASGMIDASMWHASVIYQASTVYSGDFCVTERNGSFVLECNGEPLSVRVAKDGTIVYDPKHEAVFLDSIIRKIKARLDRLINSRAAP